MSVGTDSDGGPLPPRANPRLVGHAAAEARLLEAYRSGRLHHAWLIHGPPGIGKATLAYRFARFLLSRDAEAPATDGLFGPAPEPDTLEMAPESRVFRMVASGGHPDLLTIERRWDEKKKRMPADIPVDDVRASAEFLRLTAHGGGWRVVVVDSADEMNRNGANAMLKWLEEPPRQVIFLLVSHSPGSLLPTIRSRCQSLRLSPLVPGQLAGLIAELAPEQAGEGAAMLAALADGSVGRALSLARDGGGTLLADALAVVATLPMLDRARLQKLADGWSRAVKEGAPDPFATGTALLLWWLSRAVRLHADGTRPAVAIPGESTAAAALLARHDPAEIMRRIEEIAQFLGRGTALHLDRRHMVMETFLRLSA